MDKKMLLSTEMRVAMIQALDTHATGGGGGVAAVIADPSDSVVLVGSPGVLWHAAAVKISAAASAVFHQRNAFRALIA